jgi:hypothetical protein
MVIVLGSGLALRLSVFWTPILFASVALAFRQGFFT